MAPFTVSVADFKWLKRFNCTDFTRRSERNSIFFFKDTEVFLAVQQHKPLVKTRNTMASCVKFKMTEFGHFLISENVSNL